MPPSVAQRSPPPLSASRQTRTSIVPLDADGLKRAAREIGRGVKPIFVIEEGGAKRQIGTAFALSNGDKRLFITANHVLAGPLEKGIGISKAGAARWPMRYGKLETVAGLSVDPDVAFATAVVDSSVDSALAFMIPQSQTVTGVEARTGIPFMAIGYPRSKGRFRDAQRRWSNKLMYAVVQSEPLEVYEMLGLNPRVHIAAHYNRDARRNIDDAPMTGADPHGMSGGVLALPVGRRGPDGNDDFELMVAGVLTEYHKSHNTLVATRIDCILDAVAPFRDPSDRVCHGVDV